MDEKTSRHEHSNSIRISYYTCTAVLSNDQNRNTVIRRKNLGIGIIPKNTDTAFFVFAFSVCLYRHRLRYFRYGTVSESITGCASWLV